ncbi:MAG: RrF2 family transcriptional regulator [Candidatus Cloacimonadia bacterium]
MVKISTKTRYGTRAMLDLALHYGEGPVPLKDIATRQGISERYLENIMTALVSAGLLQSRRGQQGGFKLSRLPCEIKLSQIIQVLEGSLAMVKCADDYKTCDRAIGCTSHEIWKILKNGMIKILDSITLEDMVNMEKKKCLQGDER